MEEPSLLKKQSQEREEIIDINKIFVLSPVISNGAFFLSSTQKLILIL